MGRPAMAAMTPSTLVSRKLAFVDLLAVAQDGEAVGDAEDLLEPVRDVDDADALGP